MLDGACERVMVEHGSRAAETQMIRTSAGRFATSLTLAAIPLLLVALVLAHERQPFLKPPWSQDTPQSIPRFDTLVREDFFAGIGGDSARFDRAMQFASEELAKHPDNAEAKVWHGAGTYMLAKRWFRQGDASKGVQLKRDGLREMDDAIALDPENVAVLIPRASILLSAARYIPNPEDAKGAYEKAVADCEKILKLQSSYFQSLGEHPRGELLGALAEGWSALGNQEKSRAYLNRICTELPNSVYAAKAAALLAAPRQGTLGITCLGCHSGNVHSP